MSERKLSATMLSTYLKSPRAYYYSYIHRGAGIEPHTPSAASYDHDKLLGIVWADVVDRFYAQQMGETDNTLKAMEQWIAVTDGWLDEKIRVKYGEILAALCADYYEKFRHDDGARNPAKSEWLVEDDLLRAHLDGMSDESIIHEVKSTSRCPNSTEQLWKFHHSLQVKLYAVLTDAAGVQIEFAYKDYPCVSDRTPVKLFTAAEKAAWRTGIRSLAAYVRSLGDDINNYPCRADGCCLITKRFIGMCPWQALCDGSVPQELEHTLFKVREVNHR